MAAVMASMNLGAIQTRLGHFADALPRLEAALAHFEGDDAAARWRSVAANHLATGGSGTV